MIVEFGNIYFAVRARVSVSPLRGNDNNERFFTQTSVS